MSAKMKDNLKNGVFDLSKGKVIDVVEETAATAPAPAPEPPPPQPLDQVLVVYTRGRDPMGFAVTANTAIMVFHNILARETSATATEPARLIKHIIFDHSGGAAILLTEDVQLVTVHKQETGIQEHQIMPTRAGFSTAVGQKPN